GKRKEPLPDAKTEFITTRVDEDLAQRLESQDIAFRRTIENTLFRDILSWVLPVFFFIAIWLFIMRRAGGMGGGMGGGGGGFLSVGKSKARIYAETDIRSEEH